ncbi:MAG: sensor histidine kinase [Candidatus Hodarchaeales archaeon]
MKTEMSQGYIKMKQLYCFINNHLVTIVGIFILFVLYLTSLYNYLLFHSLVELSSIVVAISIFIIVWNTRRMTDNQFVILLSTSYFAVAIIDLLHVMSYKGIELFTGYDTNLPTQLWILARYFESTSLLIAVTFSWKLSYRKTMLSYGFFTGFFTALIFLKIFPDCYIEGTGLTLFKILSEYVIITILIAVIVILYVRRGKIQIDSNTYKYLILACLMTISAELSFTFYISVYDISNLIGHFFKLFSFYMIYKAVVENCLQNPLNTLFQNLKRRENDLKNQKDDLELLVSILSHDLKNHHVISLGALDLAESLIEKEDYAKVPAILGLSISGLVSAENLLNNISIILKQQLSYEYQLYPVDIRDCIDRSVENLSKIFPKKNISIKVIAPSECFILGDSLIDQLVINVLINAVKSDYQDEISIEIKLKEEIADNKVILSILDHGKGVHPDLREEIFDRFSSFKKKGKGSGLGLFIVKTLVDRYGGKIWIENRVPDDHSKGTVFKIQLNLAKPHEENDSV